MVDGDRMLDRLLRLIRVDSPSRREGRMAALVRDELAALGLQAHADDAHQRFGGEVGNLICRLPGADDLPPLMLNAHLDTVEPGQGIEPRVLNGTLRSAGDTILGADDKAGVTAILEALQVLRERRLPHPPLEIVFTVAEEVGLLGARHLDCSALSARTGFALDAAGPVGGIVVRAPGEEKFVATIKGRAAHAGVEPEQGVNAIAIAVRAVAGMRLGRIDDQTTANVGTIHGGTAINIVPDRAVLEGEVRSHDPGRLRAQMDQIVERFRAEAQAAGGEAEIETEVLYERFALGDDDLPVALARSAAAEMNLPFALKSSGGGSDANIFNAYGIATGVLAIGCDKTHTTDETMPLDQLQRLGELTVRVIARAAEMAAPP